MAANTIPPWFSGSPVAEKLNSWLHYLLVRLPIDGANTAVFQTANGRAINAKAGGAVAPANNDFPWKIVAVNEGDDVTPDWKATLLPGSINSVIASNMFDTFDLVTGLNYLKLKCVTDGTDVTSSTIASEITAPAGLTSTENMAGLAFEDVLGMVTIETTPVGQTTYQVRYNNLTATPIISFLESQTPAGPGEEPFVRWWKWQVSP